MKITEVLKDLTHADDFRSLSDADTLDDAISMLSIAHEIYQIEQLKTAIAFEKMAVRELERAITQLETVYATEEQREEADVEKEWVDTLIYDLQQKVNDLKSSIRNNEFILEVE